MRSFWKKYRIVIIACAILPVITPGCKGKEKLPPLFSVLEPERTGIHFSNDLSYTKEFNLFKYIYFYNGSGVGAGDLNNDGLIDLFFGSNQQQDRLYLNMGDMRFKDVTTAAGIPDDGGWTTGISVVDINSDGLLDIYICRVGKYETLNSRNLLLVCEGINDAGIPTYRERALEYGLGFSGFSTQAGFLDYDMDGDLDMFLLNHSVHENGTFRPRKEFTGTYHPLAGHRFYRNDGGHFTDVTRETGINSNAIGYGLGIAISDINLDGYPDIYIGNDFHEDDYLYINAKDGTFSEEGRRRMMHTSQFSMGVDVADVNNDAYPEIISVDMLPSDPYILKRSLGEDAFDIFQFKISVGYSHQYARNNFQFNRRNGIFSEVALYSGIAATDWSWAPLWVDFDNDGRKDLFISNGIPKRMNDIDYINFVSNAEVQQKIRANSMEQKDMALIDKFPEIKLPDKFYRNAGDLSFEDYAYRIENSKPGFSNGAVYADLDNDGDLDLIANNIDAPALIYENRTMKPGSRKPFRLAITGPGQNMNAVGARLIVYSGAETRTYEKFPAKGFLSSMEIPLQAGLEGRAVDSIHLVWPDMTFQRLRIPADTALMKIKYRAGLPSFDFRALQSRMTLRGGIWEDISGSSGLNYLQEENHFIEFDREPLIPHMVSTEGPALAVGDFNQDGLDDVFIGGARNKKPGLFMQFEPGRFRRLHSEVLDADSIYEDVDACWADLNKDGHPDLLVASGGNEFYGNDAHNTPRIYINDGAGNFEKKHDAFRGLYLTASSIEVSDFDNDGFPDIFLGGRTVPWGYGQVPRSYLLRNDGKGGFAEVSGDIAPGLNNAGLVTNARWFDLDLDGDEDLLLSLEWGNLLAFINEKGKFSRRQLTDRKGWWNFLLPFDADGDGDIDLIAGNLGLNSRLKASITEPVRLYYNDFDGNGRKEQVLTTYLAGREVPFANKSELEKQMPSLKKDFLYAEDFAKASLSQLFSQEKLGESALLTADYFANALLINQGNLRFETRPLPFEAQFTCFRDAVTVHANRDSLPDVLIVGNYYDNNIQMGRYDADFGTILINMGGGEFVAETLNGLTVRGQVRRVDPVRTGEQNAYILARNSDSLMLVRLTGN